MNDRNDEELEIEAIRLAVKQAKPVYVTPEGDITVGDRQGSGTKIKEGTFHAV